MSVGMKAIESVRMGEVEGVGGGTGRVRVGRLGTGMKKEMRAGMMS